jgi:hypothetical protein
MTPDERAIIGYLLAENQKTFTCDHDGGNAATLISRGIVVLLVRPGQVVDPLNVPMTIPDPLWNILQAHKEQFPHRRNAEEGHPWRVNWMVR